MEQKSNMLRRSFIKLLSFGGPAAITFPSIGFAADKNENIVNPETREYWVNVLTKIAHPVLSNLSEGKLALNMPVQVHPDNKRDRSNVTRLEAFGRLIAGISPWLELGEDGSTEGKLRAQYIGWTRKSIAHAVDPTSRDFMDFHNEGQALVDTAFLAHGLLRAPKQLWEPLDSTVKANVIAAFKSSRDVKPGYNNWLLFSAMVEAFLLKTGNGADLMRIDFAIKKHLEWYKGDGTYGDGNEFHWDYYNSFVIQPMLLDVTKVLVDSGKEKKELYEQVLKRAQRYAEVQERMISPEGTYPPLGRSLAYRFGAFQTLAQLALTNTLPETLHPAQVRSALSAVIDRSISGVDTFDKSGWLNIGFCGHQPRVAEIYISTGSLYLCSVGLLPLGLPPADAFWTAPAEEWTSKRIWSGKEVRMDHALE